MVKLVNKRKKDPNKYLSAFLFGGGKPSNVVYIHFARRFTYFKEGLSRFYFNWHAWLLAPFYSVYRGLYRRAFIQIILLIMLLTIIICSTNLYFSAGSLLVWLIITNIMAYKSDYSLYRLYLKKIEQYDIKSRGDDGFRKLVTYGGRHYGAVVFCMMIIFLVVGLIYYYRIDIIMIIELLYRDGQEQLIRLQYLLSNLFERLLLRMKIE